jgi:hypothetical protein
MGGSPEDAGPPAKDHLRTSFRPVANHPAKAHPTVKDMNRNRHNTPRDRTSRMIHSDARPSDMYSWLRTLREVRRLPEVAA